MYFSCRDKEPPEIKCRGTSHFNEIIFIVHHLATDHTGLPTTGSGTKCLNDRVFQNQQESFLPVEDTCKLTVT